MYICTSSLTNSNTLKMELKIWSNIGFVNSNTLAFGQSESIGFVNIDKKQLEFQYVFDKKINNRGVSCIAANQTESIYAIDDTLESRILLFLFPNTECISYLKSDESGKKTTLNTQICLKYRITIGYFVYVFFFRFITKWIL